ncbi:MAG: transcriptional regulator [Sphingomonas sp.]|nr:MAG: transcriptional regulator [Sphingomonas sp.]
MRVFLDFEASSLGKKGYPIEVGWVWEDGRAEGHLIRPAPEWQDWDERAAAIHHLTRERLAAEGEPHDAVARRMIEQLTGHDLLASAPSWDGKWLSTLLRAAGRPRHALRLRDTEAAWAEAVADALGRHADARPIIAAARADAATWPVAHRAVDDAERERRLWLSIRTRAQSEAARG